MKGFNGTNYFGTHLGAPQVLQGTPNYSVEVSEGCNPPGEFYPATYLPTVVSENRLQGSAYVLMPGKVIAFDKQKANRNGRLVTAGLAYDFAEYCVAEAAVPASGVGVNKYSQLCVDNGVIGLDGARVAAGDEVAADIFAAAAQFPITDIATGEGAFTLPIGIMRYSSLMAPGTDPSNPATFYKHAYDTGGARAFSRWAYIQIPVLEVNDRIESIAQGVTSHRIALYHTGALTITGNPTLKATPNLFTAPAGATADQYAIVGRTIMFNGPVAAAVTVTYTPVVDTPFTCLKVKTSNGAAVAANGSNAVISSQLIGEAVTFDYGSNYVLKDLAAYANAGGCANYNIGRILDVKNGSDKDLALVLTWYRDAGLWQEQPGSATDGRNTQLALTNAPRYVARIAVDFTNLNTWYV